MSSKDRRRQKKIEKHKKKRELARGRRSRPAELPTSARGLIRLVSTAPFGPVWVSTAVWSDANIPELVPVAITRRLPHGLLLGEIALVDRTCLGVKNAFVMRPMTEAELEGEMAQRGVGGFSFERCEPLFAQSVVFHALDYARGLGFAPHRDFEPALFEPRPAELLDTPLSRPEKPYFVSGPNDDVRQIVWKLDATVGAGNYHFTLGAGALGLLGTDLDDLDDDLDDDDDLDEDDEILVVDARSLPRLGAGDDQRVAHESGPPAEDVLDGIDLDDAFGLNEAVDALVHMLESDHFLSWEAVVRDELDLPLSPAQERALSGLVNFGDDDDRIDFIDGFPRPSEPWYETVRRVAPRLVLERFETWQAHPDRLETRGAQLLAAIERHAQELSLPEGCASTREVLLPELWHRLRVQRIFQHLSGVGQEIGGGAITLTGDSGPWRIQSFAEALDEEAESLAALGWTLDDLLEVLVLPERDRAILVAGLAERGHPLAGASRRPAETA